MKKILFSVFVALSMGRFAFAYEVGKKVLVLCEESYQKATIIEVSKEHSIKLKYDSPRWNEKCKNTIEHYENIFNKKVLPYEPVQRFQHNFGRLKSYDFKVGQNVYVKCGDRSHKGKVVDISSNGYIYAKFETSYNSYWKFIEESGDYSVDEIIAINETRNEENAILKYCDGYVKFSNIRSTQFIR